MCAYGRVWVAWEVWSVCTRGSRRAVCQCGRIIFFVFCNCWYCSLVIGRRVVVCCVGSVTEFGSVCACLHLSGCVYEGCELCLACIQDSVVML